MTAKARDVRTTRDKNRAIRQEALREQLSSQGHVQYVHENVKKLEDELKELDPVMVQRLRAANDARLKLIAKYLPDLKSTEITGEGGGDLQVQIIRFAESVE